jgi:hypothetical protein
MPKKEGYSQLELFSQSGDNAANKGVSRSFLIRIWGYEKVILIAIALLVTAIISFSIGVERGKNLAARRINLRIDVASNKAAPGSATQLATASKQPVTLTPQKSESYAIQLATFGTKTLAQKEIELLRKKGYAPLVISKGKYIILYVGNFSNKELANKVLGEFKKRYSDCRIIRRL